MGNGDSPRRWMDAYAQESLREHLKELGAPPPVPPTLDYLLEHTHTLSNKVEGFLSCALRAHGRCEEPVRQDLETAVELATDCITCLRVVMLTIHRLRRSPGVEREEWSNHRL